MIRIIKKALPPGVKKFLIELTIIELVIVLVFIAIIAVIFFVSFQPAEHFAKTRNIQRWQDINLILNAVVKYQVDNDGQLPSGIDEKIRVLGTATSGCSDCSASEIACLDLSDELVGDYLDFMPYGPKNGSPIETRYAISKMTDGRIRIVACDSESENGRETLIEVIR